MRTESVPPHASSSSARRLSAGAEVLAGGVHFRVRAPACRQVDVRIESGTPALHPLAQEGSGWFSAPGARVG